MLLLHDQGIRSQVQIMGFSLSVCHIHRVVDIVDSYLCNHCYVCLIISLINFIPFGLSEKSFYQKSYPFERFDKPFRNFT